MFEEIVWNRLVGEKIRDQSKIKITFQSYFCKHVGQDVFEIYLKHL